MADSFEGELNALESSLKVIRIEYERFFAGDLKRPPLERRRQIEERFRRFSNTEIDRVADRFRLQSLEGRYNSMRELWEKRLRMREEGSPLEAPQKAAPKEAVDAPAAAPVKVRRRVDFTPLFTRYCEARRALGEDV